MQAVKRDMNQVSSIRCTGKSMVIACVVPATEDSANIIAWQMAQDYDKDGERTIGEICAALVLRQPHAR